MVIMNRDELEGSMIEREYYQLIDRYTIGSTEILIVNQFMGGYYGQANTYLVERNGIWFHMSGQELEAQTGAFPY